MSTTIRQRLRNKWRRYTVSRYARRDFTLTNDVPYVSFTFDDFPRTAFVTGGRILADHGACGTYFVSGKLLGGPSPSGPIATRNDIGALIDSGHELGCHTFEHLDGTRATVAAFERSILANRAALADMLPEGDFEVFGYPLNGPVVAVKRAVGRHFVACRGGGQTFNAGAIDLNLLHAYFIDSRNRGDLDAVRRLLAANATARGWLIFATHDVADRASDYGCAPHFLEDVVRLSLHSGARVRTMGEALREMSAAKAPRVG